MSVQLESTGHTSTLRLVEEGVPRGSQIGIRLTSKFRDESVGGDYGRADFLDAIRTELNVIVIDRADLPEVSAGQDSYLVGDRVVPDDYTAAEARTAAREYLAVAEYLDAHPPVDEAQVEALAKIIRERYDETGDVTRYPTEHSLARRLVERGVRVEAGDPS